ncbi:MAG: hypothetical protein IMZ53_03430 [Thermoplasmata archaeon]|nr:hypothetical protein [Thermoplasmata archaeon]MBE3139616.1 hypothetical protein [Thermoplasmata archaeon]
MESNEPIPTVSIPVRKYHRYERGLESIERRHLASGRMASLVKKASARYNVQFRIPDFRPVFISKKLKKYGGLFCGDKIKIAIDVAKSRWANGNTLWHEVVHSFISDNWLIYQNSNTNITWADYKPFERNIFRMAINDGSHHSQNWKLMCGCTFWWKTVNKQKEKFCPRCNMYIISPTEFKKLKKIAELGSRKFHIDITKYKPWQSNERIIE